VFGKARIKAGFSFKKLNTSRQSRSAACPGLKKQHMKIHAEDNHELVRANHNDLQMMPLSEALNWYNQFVTFSKSILKMDLDYGVIPGTPKPSLYKPGAEKLRLVYGLGSEQECIEKSVDLDRPYIDYTYRCTIKSKQGQILAQCEGSCNSMEPKFGYTWKAIDKLPFGIDVSLLPSRLARKKITEFDFAIRKGETTGPYGKPQAYWNKWRSAIEEGIAKKHFVQRPGRELEEWEMDETAILYRIPNPNVISMKNTIMKMAQKRAFVGAILVSTGASEFYTQDIEDMELNGQVLSNEKQVPEEPEQAEIHQRPEKKVKHEVPGLWYARLEKCKTPDEIDELGKKHATTINANPDLRRLFVIYKMRLKKNMPEA
jgi:hypothetical protein